jgi:hypothetical protein
MATVSDDMSMHEEIQAEFANNLLLGKVVPLLDKLMSAQGPDDKKESSEDDHSADRLASILINDMLDAENPSQPACEGVVTSVKNFILLECVQENEVVENMKFETSQQVGMKAAIIRKGDHQVIKPEKRILAPLPFGPPPPADNMQSAKTNRRGGAKASAGNGAKKLEEWGLFLGQMPTAVTSMPGNKQKVPWKWLPSLANLPNSGRAASTRS